MIVLYIAFAIAGVLAFVLLSKVGMPLRIAIALLVAIGPSIALTVWVASVGDKPPPDARTIVPSPKDEDRKSD